MTIAEVLLKRISEVKKRTDKEAVVQRMAEIARIADECLQNKLITQGDYELIAERAGILF